MARQAAARGEQYQLNVSLQPKAIQFMSGLNYDDFVNGCGGAKGGLKSHTCRNANLLRRYEWQGTIGTIFRKTRPGLRDNQWNKLLEEQPWLIPFSNADDFSIALPYSGGSKLLFRYGETLADVTALRGREFGDLFIDEAQDLTQEELEILYSCARSTTRSIGQQSKKQFRARIGLFFNPGGISHSYLKRVFIDKKLLPAEKRLGFRFTQTYVWDNAMWVREQLEKEGQVAPYIEFHAWPEEKRRDYVLEHADYVKNLAVQKNKVLLDAWLYGKWDISAGQYFDIFDEAIHTFAADEFRPMPWWRWWVSADWGFVHKTAAYLHCTDGRNIWTVREVVVDREEPYQVGQAILRLVPEDLRERIGRFVLSHETHGRRTSYRTIADEIYEPIGRATQGLFPRPVANDLDREGGLQIMYNGLAAVTHGRPEGRWRISRECRALIKAIPLAFLNEKKPNDVLEFEDDDPLHGARYGVKVWPEMSEMSADQKRNEWVSQGGQISNPNVLFMRETIARAQFTLKPANIRTMRRRGEAAPDTTGPLTWDEWVKMEKTA